MKHIKTIETRNLCESAKKGGCGECQTSCQSACKTSCGIANQECENKYLAQTEMSPSSDGDIFYVLLWQRIFNRQRNEIVCNFNGLPRLWFLAGGFI